jgi:mono/diheme cytochrome c family protein
LIKRILIGVVLVPLVGFAGISWRPAVAPVSPPAPESFAPALIERGAQLAAAGNCAGCHTAPGGSAYSGGLGLETGFGLAYSTNITPEPQTGIGNWSEQAFTRAMRKGVDREGSHLLPAFPYTHFTKLTDGDVKALYAFFMTRPAVIAPDRVNTIKFPANVRALLAGWKLLFFERGVYQNVSGKSQAWNRGAYLAEGIAHCAACHTPRNRLGAEQGKAAYAGAPFEGWLAPPLNAANPAPMPWTQQDLYDDLRTGESEAHGVAAGAMASVVHEGFAKLPDANLKALATYFADVNGSAARAKETTQGPTCRASQRH